jgi:hypothetical protein
LNGADGEFLESVRFFLDKHPELKNIFDEKTQPKPQPENISVMDSIELPVTYDDMEIVTIPKDPKLKTLYRSIVKSTHPDKVNSNLSELYLEATKAYDEDNILPIIVICDKLNIPFEVTDDEISKIKNEIQLLRQRSNFLENTYTWKWSQQTDEKIKEMVILSYVRKQII